MTAQSTSRFIAAAAVLVLTGVARATEGKSLAVLQIRNKLAADQRREFDSEYLTNVIRTAALRGSRSLHVITRENVLVILQSQGKTLEDCQGECEIETGRRLGADYVATGDLLRFGSAFKLDLRLYETSQGRLLGGAQASGRSADELDERVPAAVAALLSSIQRAGQEATPVDDGANHRAVSDGGGPPSPGDELAPSPDVPAGALLALDKATRADEAGLDDTDEAIAAWHVLANEPSASRYRTAAVNRKQWWEGFAARQGAAIARLAPLIELSDLGGAMRAKLMQGFEKTFGKRSLPLLVARVRSDELRTKLCKEFILAKFGRAYDVVTNVQSIYPVKLAIDGIEVGAGPGKHHIPACARSLTLTSGTMTVGVAAFDAGTKSAIKLDDIQARLALARMSTLDLTTGLVWRRVVGLNARGWTQSPFAVR